jgi:hypothetical protein
LAVVLYIIRSEHNTKYQVPSLGSGQEQENDWSGDLDWIGLDIPSGGVRQTLGNVFTFSQSISSSPLSLSFSLLFLVFGFSIIEACLCLTLLLLILSSVGI